jgi:hypothetical protein
MTKKKGKKKQPQKKLTFKDVIQRYKSQDYEGAAWHLKRIFVQSHEKSDASQLEAELTHRQALEHIEKFQFKEALGVINTPPLFPPNEQQPALLAINHALAGLCHLYLGDWTAAEHCLERAIQHKSIAEKFTFYYLLSLIYGGKCDDFNAFSTRHTKLIEKVGSRAPYLKAAWHLTRREWNEADAILAGFEPQTDSHRNNLMALQAILNGQFPEQAPTVSLLFPLYKALMNLNLTKEEFEYLRDLPALTDSMAQYAAREEGFRMLEGLRGLCLNAIPLSKQEFINSFKALPDSQKPFLVYNQASALFSQDLENTYDDLLSLVNDYEKWFFQTPESIFIYLKLVIYDSETLTYHSIFKNLNDWFARFGAAIQPATLEVVGWMIYQAIRKGRDDINTTKLIRKEITSLARRYPDLLAFKTWLMKDFILFQETPPPPEALDLFSRPGLPAYKDNILEAIGMALKALSPKTLNFFFEREGIVLDKEISTVHLRVCASLLEFLRIALEKFPPASDTRIVLDLLGQLAHEQQEVIKYGALPEEHKKSLEAAYEKWLPFFGENQPGSDYYEQYQRWKNAEQHHKRQQLFTQKSSPEKLKNDFHNRLVKGEATIIADDLLNHIESDHFPTETSRIVRVFFTTCLKWQPEKAVDTAADFFKRYPHLAIKHKCHCAWDLLVDILKDLTVSSCADSPEGCKIVCLAAEATGKYFSQAPIIIEDDLGLRIAILTCAQKVSEADPGFRLPHTFINELIQNGLKAAQRLRLKDERRSLESFDAYFQKMIPNP